MAATMEAHAHTHKNVFIHSFNGGVRCVLLCPAGSIHSANIANELEAMN